MVPRPRNGLSLCAVGAGLDMGLMLAEPGFHTRCFVEWEEYPRSVIIAAQRAGYLERAPIWDDLTTFDARPLSGAIDTLLAGYPCQLVSERGRTTNDTCSPMSPELPKNLETGSTGFSSRTSQGTSALVVRPCCEPYDKWASRLRLAYSKRKKSVRRKKGSGGSAWPTAKAVSGGANSQWEARGAGGPDLQEAAQNWPTARAEDSESAGMRHSRGVADTLTAVTANWPTATSTDANGACSFGLDGQRIRANAGPTLNDLAHNWPTPMAGTPAQNGNSQAGNSDFSRKAEELARNLWATPAPMQTREGWTAEARSD